MKTVLFVCEHGSAKSIVAAAHFNRLAAERGLDLRAVSRGTDPDREIHPAAMGGLRVDDLQPQSEPRLLSPLDLEAAHTVIAFSALRPEFQASVTVQVWTVPSVSQDYEASRNSIVDCIGRLLEDLAQQK